MLRPSRRWALAAVPLPCAGAAVALHQQNGYAATAATIDGAAYQTIDGPGATPRYAWKGGGDGQVWLSHQAKAYGVNRFYANAWSTPGHTKRPTAASLRPVGRHLPERRLAAGVRELSLNWAGWACAGSNWTDRARTSTGWTGRARTTGTSLGRRGRAAP